MEGRIFRGKNLKKKWVEGYLFTYPGMVHPVIILAEKPTNGFSWEYVKPETVAAFTGTTDRAGTWIFVQDIVRDTCTGEIGIVLFGRYRNLTDSIYTEHIGFYIEWKNSYMKKDIGFWVGNGSIEVIGNIIDNENLMEREKEDVSGSRCLQETSEMACAAKT